MTQNTYLWGGVVIAIVIAIIGWILPVLQPGAGGITTGTAFTHGISVGNPATLGVVPTNFKKFLGGTCNLSQTSAGSHAATTSKEYFCAVTGVASGDLVRVTLPAGAGNNPNGASSLFGGFVVNSAYATTTGIIAVSIANMTGAATSSFTQATTSASYWVYATQ